MKIVPSVFFWGFLLVGGFLYLPEALLTRLSAYVILISLPTVVLAYYWWLPKVGASLGTSLMQGFLQAFTVKGRMSELSEKGVAARQEKALVAQEQGLLMAAVAQQDPLKAIAMPLIENIVDGAIDSWGGPKLVKEQIKANLASLIPSAIASSKVNFTNWAVQGLDSKFNWGLAEKIKALGVITNAEKVQ